MSIKKGLLKLSVLFVLFAGTAAAQSPVKWSLSSQSAEKTLKADDIFNVELKAEIESGWHLYALEQPEGGPIPMSIKVAEGAPFSIEGSIKSPKPTVLPDPNFIIDGKPLITKFFEDQAIFSFTLRSAADAGAQDVAINVKFQLCNDTFCLPPKTVKVTFSGVEEKKNSAVLYGISNPPPKNYGPQAAEWSIWSFIWLAASFGAISLLMPCVFPMIPITVSYFLKNSDGNHAKTIKLAAVFSAGIIAAFSLLGMLLAVVLGAAGINFFAANPWINLLIAAMFIFFAFNLFGFYEISIPAPLLTRLDRLTRTEEGKGSKYIGALLMGLTFTLTSFTCTSPFIGTILVSTSQGDWKLPLLGMLAFSTVFAFPFFLLAIVPRFLQSLPRAGGWLNSVKVVMGFLEVAAAMKFISNADLVLGAGLSGSGMLNYGRIFTRELVLLIWIIIDLGIILYILGVFKFRNESRVSKITPLRFFFAAAFFALSIYLATGILGKKMGELESFLPPKNADSAFNILGSPADELKWITNDFQAALTRAKQENKKVFVDFTGYTCTNCRWMEANMFTRPEVKEEMGKYVLASLYTDGEGEIYERQQQFQQKTFQTVALPFYAVFDSNGKPLATFPGLTRNAPEFVDFLKKAQEN